MNTLEVKDFTGGWNPSMDPLNGPKNALCRMDNGMLDEHGAITICRGAAKVHTTQFAGSVHSIYSRQLAGTKYRYVGLSNSSVLRDHSNDFGDTILTGGGGAASLRTAFGAGYNYVYIISGSKKKKDTGAAQYNFGVAKPTTAVSTAAATSPQLTLTDSYSVTLAEGSNLASGATYFSADSSATTFRIDAFRTFAATRNMMDFGSSRYGLDDDLISFSFRCADFSKFESLQIQFYFGTVDGSPDSSPDLTDYYGIELLNDNTQFVREGVDQWSRLQFLRSEFTRFGTDAAKNWTNVAGVRFVAKFTEAAGGIYFANIFLNGSTGGPLKGSYEYRQVNVGNNGSYNAKSASGPAMNYPQEVNNSYITVTPENPSGLSDAQINEVWIFRRLTGLEGSDPRGRFLRVKVLTSSLGSAFSDTVSDELAADIDIPLNENLIGLQDSAFPNDVYYMEVNYKERTLFMTPREIYLSEPLNPDAVDLRYIIKLSGDAFEINLWMLKAGPSSILVGTTNDIYEIQGDLTELPDGTINANVVPLGTKQPPLADTVCLYDNTVYYLSSDGIRSLRGATNTSFSGPLDLLFKRYTRSGHLPVLSQAANTAASYIVAGANKLFYQATLSDASRTVFVFDFPRNYWYKYVTDPSALFVEEDDTILAGYADASDFYLRQIDVGTTFDGSGQSINLRFAINNDNLPLNRKDSYTLKLKVDTGNVNCTLKIYKDESTSATSISAAASSNGMGEISFDISSLIGLAKSYQLEITATALQTFRLTEWAIEYDPRPKQTKYLRIPPNNYGTAGRKRFPTCPFVIDTLGNDVTFTPTIDGSDKTTSTVNTSDKQVHNHLFTSDQKGYVIGGKLQGSNYFEYYELVQPRVIELLPDPEKFAHVPFTNLGFQGRKRFIAFAFVIDTGGADVTFTPIIDGTSGTPSTVNTNGKLTYIHYFTTDTVGTDIGGTLSGTSQFELYGINLEECISEKMPPPSKFLLIPQEDLGSPNRKRFSSFKFLINTKGGNVTFTPRIDGVNGTPSTVNTSEKDVHEHFFTDDTIGKAIGGKLSGSAAFEYYGPLKEQDIEVLPPRLKYFKVPANNFGAPAKKRVRTLPMVINTNGNDVTFTPVIDLVAGTPATFNTASKQTVLYYFTEDSFGIDYEGILSGSNPFEFYGMLKPEDVEVIPVGKKFDQIGPIEFPKIGKVIEVRLRMIAEGTSISYEVFAEDSSIYTGTLTVNANRDDVYTIKFPKGINATVFRLTLSSTSPMHRYYARVKVNTSGMETDSKWMMFGADPDAKAK